VTGREATVREATGWEARAAELDAADPLARFRERFLPIPDVTSPGVVAYLDGNSLGRPPVVTAERLDRFVREEWGGG
jgi:Kynureninase